MQVYQETIPNNSTDQPLCKNHCPWVPWWLPRILHILQSWHWTTDQSIPVCIEMYSKSELIWSVSALAHTFKTHLTIKYSLILSEILFLILTISLITFADNALNPTKNHVHGSVDGEQDPKGWFLYGQRIWIKNANAPHSPTCSYHNNCFGML